MRAPCLTYGLIIARNVEVTKDCNRQSRNLHSANKFLSFLSSRSSFSSILFVSSCITDSIADNYNRFESRKVLDYKT